MFHDVNLKVKRGCVFYAQSAVNLSVICESKAVNGKPVDNPFEWQKVHQEEKGIRNRSLGYPRGQWHV